MPLGNVPPPRETREVPSGPDQGLQTADPGAPRLTLDRQKKPSLQPKLWLLATSLGLGIGAGLLFGPQPEVSNQFGRPGWELFLVAAIVQLALGWFAMRAGEDPDSLLANFVRANPPYGAPLDLEPKPILWFFAYVLFLMSSFIGTISLTSLLASM